MHQPVRGTRTAVCTDGSARRVEQLVSSPAQPLPADPSHHFPLPGNFFGHFQLLAYCSIVAFGQVVKMLHTALPARFLPHICAGDHAQL